MASRQDYHFAGGSSQQASPASQGPPSARSNLSSAPSGSGSRFAYQAVNPAAASSVSLVSSAHHGQETPPRANPFSDARSASTNSSHPISDKFSLAPDPTSWGAAISPDQREPDDHLHAPEKKGLNDSGTIWTGRGLANLGCLFILVAAIVMLFAGYPILSYFLTDKLGNEGGFNLGGINATGQVMETAFALVDPDTPDDALTYTANEDGEEWVLVFSDEFDQDGRTFYPGDDPFWEACDMHYWGTNNLEWYDPSQLITQDGKLVITLEEAESHDLDYKGGLMTTWNKFCFTGGILIASVMLPGAANVPGLWPAVWTMGNLGRAGYGASVDGMWPYSYEACDTGTLANQTNGEEPAIALTSGSEEYNFELSYLVGQRLSSCTCPGEAHPGPMNKDKTFVGRSAPEIDALEATVSKDLRGHASQTCQFAPFNAFYDWDQATYMTIYTPEDTEANTYKGNAYQQCASAITFTTQKCYEENDQCYATYGFEYKPGFEEDGGYITWLLEDKWRWRLDAGGMKGETRVDISARPVPKEPMYLIVNLGISHNFGDVDFENLNFPTHMYIDYIRVYQHPDRINIGCDPPNFPTSNYINAYLEAYTNPNLTTWTDDYGQPMPKNRLIDECD